MTWEERNIFGSTVYETDNKQIIRNNIDKLNSVICLLLYFGSEMAICFMGLIWLLTQCGGTEEIMFQCELLGQHGPSPLKGSMVQWKFTLIFFSPWMQNKMRIPTFVTNLPLFGLGQMQSIKDPKFGFRICY